MLIHSCPVCGRRVAYPLDQAGQRVGCTHCGAHLTLPRRTAIEEETLDGLRLPPTTPQPVTPRTRPTPLAERPKRT